MRIIYVFIFLMLWSCGTSTTNSTDNNIQDTLLILPDSIIKDTTNADSTAVINLGPTQVLIKAAQKSFTMGADLDVIMESIVDPNEKEDFQFYIIFDGIPEGAEHQVSFTYDFWMDKTEVSQGQMLNALRAQDPENILIGQLESFWESAQDIAAVQIGTEYPAMIPEAYLAAVYANVRSKLEDLEPAYEIDEAMRTFSTNYAATGYRLPTEAEWEFAARGGVETDFYWDRNYNGEFSNSDLQRISEHAVWKENSMDLGMGDPQHGPHPVASKLPNGYGLYDMIGNLSEFVNDAWSYAEHDSTAVIDPQDESVLQEVQTRGGNWMNQALFLRITNRTFMASGYADFGKGFRLVRRK